MKPTLTRRNPAALPDAIPELDRVLQAFARVEASPNLDARIFASLAARRPAAHPQPAADERARLAGKSLGLRFASPRAYRLQAALVATLLVALAVTLHHAALPGPAASTSRQHLATASPVPGTALPPRESPRKQARTFASALPTTSAPAQSSSPELRAGLQPHESRPIGQEASAPGFSISSPNPALAQTSEDALALAELRAPSQPAPPQPLTPQEQLLLRAARTTSPGTATATRSSATAEPAPAAGAESPNVLSALREGLFAALTPTTNE